MLRLRAMQDVQKKAIASSMGIQKKGASKAVNDMGSFMSKTIYDYAILLISIS